VHLVGFIIRIYHNAQSSECQITFFFFVLGGMVFATAVTYRLVLNIAVLVWCKVVRRNVCGPMNVITWQQKHIHCICGIILTLRVSFEFHILYGKSILGSHFFFLISSPTSR